MGHGSEPVPVTWQIRSATSADASFLRAMLYEAAFWRPGQERPRIVDALADPHLTRYLHGWGRPGDAAVVALDPDGVRAGAAWYRLFEPAEPGYGFIDAATPELSIGVVQEQRGQGAGGALLRALLQEARAAGFSSLSLSVEPDNPARRLYERHGFVRVGGEGGAWTMRVDLRG